MAHEDEHGNEPIQLLEVSPNRQKLVAWESGEDAIKLSFQLLMLKPLALQWRNCP